MDGTSIGTASEGAGLRASGFGPPEADFRTFFFGAGFAFVFGFGFFSAAAFFFGAAFCFGAGFFFEPEARGPRPEALFFAFAIPSATGYQNYFFAANIPSSYSTISPRTAEAATVSGDARYSLPGPDRPL